MNLFFDSNVPALPKYPYWEKTTNLVKVMSDVLFEEIASIVSDCSQELNHGAFVSLASDFYKDQFR